MSDKVDILSTVPFLREGVRMRPSDEDPSLMILEVPKTRIGWLHRMLSRLGDPYMHLELDEIGSAMASMIGSGRNAASILEELSWKYPHETELSERLQVFLGRLLRDGVVLLKARPI